MSKTLVLEESKAKELYKTASPEFKVLLEQNFGKHILVGDMKEMITSFEAACEFNNINPQDPRFTQGTSAGIAMEMIAEIAKALNGGKVMQPGERRYYPWFEYADSGFRFDDTVCGITSADSGSGPRLCTQTAELAAYMGRTFIHLYDQLINS